MKPRPGPAILALFLAGLLSATPAEAVEVLRGGRVKAPAADARPATVLAARPAGSILLAGERLWIHDAETGRLRACTLRKTTQVGGWRVRCYGE